MIKHAERQADDDDEPERQPALARREHDDQEDEQDAEAGIDEMPRRQKDRRAGHVAVELGEGNDRAGEGDRADGDAERHLDQRLRMDLAGVADAEGLRRVKRGGGDQHRGKADQRVEGGDELRHRGHRNAPRDRRADRAAGAKRDDQEQPGEEG